MPNSLTGDFDVVALFAEPVVNRLLAAMHAIERFPHSLAVRVEDIPTGPSVDRSTIVSVVDAFGDASMSEGFLSEVSPLPPRDRPPGLHPAFDTIVNVRAIGIGLPPLEPSNFKGRAQVQLSPPTFELADATGSRISVRIQMLCRYTPDPGTPVAAEFIRGALVITAPVNQAATQAGNIVTIDIKANSATIAFTPAWSSSPISLEDMAGLNLLLRNALRSSFLPANIALPSSIRHAQFKALPGNPSSIALMLDMGSPAGNRSSVVTPFLAAADDFAVAAAEEFIRAAFQPTLDNILSQSIEPVTFGVNTLFGSVSVTYSVSLQSAELTMKTGRMVLTIRGRARTSSWTPNFDFTVRQELGLTPASDSVDLVVGALSLDTSSWIVDRFRGAAMGSFRRLRDRALAESDVRTSARRMLSANENLGGMLRATLSPASGKPPVGGAQFSLAYASVDIQPAGIVLHGALSVAAFPPPRVEYSKVTAPAGDLATAGAVPEAPQYSALRTWIPGGVIRSYEWKSAGQSGSGFLDENRFVYSMPDRGVLDALGAGGAVSGYKPLCVTVRGTRVSIAGPVTQEAIESTTCGFGRFPIVIGPDAIAGDPPLIALARSGEDGRVEIAGHVAPAETRAGAHAPNLVVHFADGDSAMRVAMLAEALKASGRSDAPTAILVVADAATMARAPFVADVTYAEERGGSWRRRFGLTDSRGAMTAIVNPAGRVVWRDEGESDVQALSEAMRNSLSRRGRAAVRFTERQVRAGQPPPDFLFDAGEGSSITLRKITGRPLVIAFWRTDARASVDLIAMLASGRDRDRLVIAVNDGERAEKARAGIASARVIVVPDPERLISKAYGVSVWPTMFEIDGTGIVRRVTEGLPPTPERPPVQRPPGGAAR